MSRPPVTPADVQVPADADAPIIVNFGVHALRMALISNHGVLGLPQQPWSAPGVYVLLGSIGGDGKTRVYVGKAKGLRSRLGTHKNRPPIPWWRALAVIRDTTDGFNTAEIGYLEGRLADELGALPQIDLKADRHDIDTSLPQHLLLQLDSFVPTILAGLRLVGLDLREQSGGEGLDTNGSKARTIIAGTVADLLAAGLLTAGTTLTFKRAGQAAHATVTVEGDLLVDGKAYTSPSTAAQKALGLKAANGWTSWKLEDGNGPSLADLRAQLPDQQETTQ